MRPVEVAALCRYFIDKAVYIQRENFAKWLVVA